MYSGYEKRCVIPLSHLGLNCFFEVFDKTEKFKVENIYADWAQTRRKKLIKKHIFAAMKPAAGLYFNIK